MSHNPHEGNTKESRKSQAVIYKIKQGVSRIEEVEEPSIQTSPSRAPGDHPLLPPPTAAPRLAVPPPVLPSKPEAPPLPGKHEARALQPIPGQADSSEAMPHDPLASAYIFVLSPATTEEIGPFSPSSPAAKRCHLTVFLSLPDKALDDSSRL
jgi:hypothetical protein